MPRYASRNETVLQQSLRFNMQRIVCTVLCQLAFRKTRLYSQWQTVVSTLFRGSVLPSDVYTLLNACGVSLSSP